MTPLQPEEREKGEPAWVLHFPMRFWLFVGFFLVGGGIADWYWLGPELRGESSSVGEVEFFLMMGPLLGIAGIWIGSQMIRITPDAIESRHLWRRTRLSTTTSYVRNYSASGYVLTDGSGRSIRVNRAMVGAEDLHRLINGNVSNRSQSELSVGMRRSKGARLVYFLKVGKAAFVLVALLISGGFLITNTTGDLIEAAKGNRPLHGGDIFLFLLGVVLVLLCLGMPIYFLKKRSRKKTLD